MNSREHSYFCHWSDFETAQLRCSGARQLMSMEFLTAHPDWRRSRSWVSVAEILAGWGLRVLQHSSAEAIITIARKDLKVPELAQRFGAIVLNSN